ncbi:PAS domain S-box protein [Paremcibacter congregatus]|uniref:PAS domain S-box protein n=1 Tax=Paremcibacter congregatus TaxID=2043170 RepID=UPI00111CB719|nr:PAS domain S-box protein [Paremcibacter congregatus]QDE28355.1 PAS domain S-box protein [Paremcibacter congregatus]
MTELIKRPLPAHMLIGVFMLVLSALVMFGWYSKSPLLIQVHAGLVPMQFNTALGFFLLGASLISLSFPLKQLSPLLAGLVLLLSLATLVQYVFNNNLGIDQLFIESYITVHSPNPGRMSLHSSLGFFFSSLGLLIPAIGKKNQWFYLFMTICGGLVLAQSIIALLGYATGYEKAYGSDEYSQMAIHTSIAFALVGVAILLLTKPPKNTISVQRYHLSALGITIVLAFFAFLAITIYSAEQRLYRNVVKTDINAISSELENDVTRLTQTLHRMGDRWTAGRTLLQDTYSPNQRQALQERMWRHDAETYLTDISSIDTLMWVTPEITVLWSENRNGSLTFSGFSPGIKQIIRETLPQPRNPAITAPAQDIIPVEDGSAVFIFHPLYAENQFQGWIVALMSIDKFMAPLAQKSLTQNYVVELINANDTVLFRSKGKDIALSSLIDRQTISFFRLNWTLKLQATPDFFKYHELPLQWLLTLMVIASLVSLFWLTRLYFKGQEQEQWVSTLYQRQSAALDTMLDGLLVISDKGIIQEVNRAALAMFGYHREDLIDRNINCLMPEPYHSGHDGYLQHYHDTGEKRIIGKKRTLTALRKDGTTFPMTLQVTEGKASNKRFYTGVIQDLTAQMAAQEKLAEQEDLVSALYQRQSAALDTMLDGLLVISDKGIIQEVNRAALAMFNYKRSDLIDRNINCLMPEPYHSGHDGYLQHYHDTGEKRIIGKKRTLTALRKDGTTFPMTLQVTEGRTKDGRFYTGVIQDLTEQMAAAEKMAEKDTLLKLAQKDAWLKLAVQDSSAGLALQNTEGKFIEVNATFCQWLGFTNEEMLDLYAEDIVTKQDLSIIRKTLKKMLSGEISVAHQERQYKTKDGSYIWCMASSTVVRNEDDKIEFIASHIINIEQEKRLGIQLKDAQSFQKLITDNNPDLIYVKDAYSRLAFANPAFIKLFPNKKINQVIDTTPNELYTQEEIDNIQTQSRKAFAEGKAEIIQKVKDPSGSPRILLNTKTRFENAEGEPFILGVARDVTAQETLIAKLEKSNQDLDQFAYIASHDLKSPLNAIQKIASWLEEDCHDILPESSKEHLSLLKSRSQRMSRLLTDLLMYSRVGRYEYKDENVNLKDITTDIFELLDAPETFTCDGQDVELDVPRIPLEIILRNLVSNAIKHHDKSKGHIKVTYEQTPTSHKIQVSDDGPGIPPELHKKATEMFQTLKSRDQVEGSGMGLAMVKKIIEHYNGHLKINSDGKRGTIVKVLWPFAKNNPGEDE